MAGIGILTAESVVHDAFNLWALFAIVAVETKRPLVMVFLVRLMRFV
jgi:hypothetical protein